MSTSVRGVITARTGRSPSRITAAIICRSPGSSTPAVSASAISDLISSSVMRSTISLSWPSSRSTALPDMSSSATSGEEIRGQDVHRRGDAGGHRLGIGQRKLLGHQLADDQRAVGDERHHDADAERIGDAARHAQFGERVGEAQADGGARKGARQHADQRDADLHGGQELAGVGGQEQGALGAGDATLGHHAQARRPGGHHGQFRHRQQTIENDQGDDKAEFDDQHDVFT